MRGTTRTEGRSGFEHQKVAHASLALKTLDGRSRRYSPEKLGLHGTLRVFAMSRPNARVIDLSVKNGTIRRRCWWEVGHATEGQQGRAGRAPA